MLIIHGRRRSSGWANTATRFYIWGTRVNLPLWLRGIDTNVSVDRHAKWLRSHALTRWLFHDRPLLTSVMKPSCTSVMPKNQDLRMRAEQARRAAQTRTYGDRTVDRELLSLADALEREAEQLDQSNNSKKL